MEKKKLPLWLKFGIAGAIVGAIGTLIFIICIISTTKGNALGCAIFSFPIIFPVELLNTYILPNYSSLKFAGILYCFVNIVSWFAMFSILGLIIELFKRHNKQK